MQSYTSNSKRLAFAFMLLAIIITVSYYFFAISNTDGFFSTENWVVSEQTYLVTAKGIVTYATLNDEVFKPLGFKLVASTVPIPTLQAIDQPSCEAIFSEWLKIALDYKMPEAPPKDIPFDLLPLFTLNNHVILSEWYINGLSKPEPKVWNQINDWMDKDPLSFSNYGPQGMSVHHSMKFMNVTGLGGCSIGSEQPWVEIIALQNGAKEMLTVEYQNTKIEGTDKITYIHPHYYAKKWKEQKQFDFIVSFSSIEHSGLQRYGDPRDPIGDIREVQKARCMLKPGGIFFLGLPRGQDQLLYNAHRSYGRIRLAMIFVGFELLHVFRDNNPLPQNLSRSDFEVTNGAVQDMFVLRKIQ